MTEAYLASLRDLWLEHVGVKITIETNPKFIIFFQAMYHDPLNSIGKIALSMSSR